MKLDKCTRHVIIGAAAVLKNDLLKAHIVEADDLPGLPPEDQMLAKVCVLVAACESIVAAAEELNNRLDVAETSIKRTEETEEKKEWN
tara:strand:- start:738 stop:1001 length:264 start_codon:yes stop_codon:yes gene_type:complete